MCMTCYSYTNSKINVLFPFRTVVSVKIPCFGLSYNKNRLKCLRLLLVAHQLVFFTFDFFNYI